MDRGGHLIRRVGGSNTFLTEIFVVKNQYNSYRRVYFACASADVNESEKLENNRIKYFYVKAFVWLLQILWCKVENDTESVTLHTKRKKLPLLGT